MPHPACNRLRTAVGVTITGRGSYSRLESSQALGRRYFPQIGPPLSKIVFIGLSYASYILKTHVAKRLEALSKGNYFEW